MATRRRYTQEDDDFIRLHYPGHGDLYCAQELGRTRASIRNRARDIGVARDGGVGAPPLIAACGVIEDDAPTLQPLSVTVPDTLVEPVLTDMPYMALVYGDVHFPFQDDQALSILYQVCEIADFSVVVDLGDLTDNWQISSFLPPDERRLKADQIELQDQFIQAGMHLGKMAWLNPGSELIFMEGNHEERWTRLFRKAQEDYRWRAVLSMPHVQEALSLPFMLGISARWKYIDYGDDHILNGRILLTHGDRTNIWVTRSNLERYGKSCMFGHTHRIQNFTKTDLNGTDSAWNIGCMCDLNPHYQYTSAVNWAQGFAIIFFSEDRQFYHVEQIRIHHTPDGRACAMTPWGLLVSS